jgi:putative DNA primase/helicase
MNRPRTHDLAKGKWKGILLQLGFPAQSLDGKGRPCPLCKDGTDRFTFDNQNGDGSYICRICGSGGNGWALLKKWRGWEFREAARQVDAVLGNVQRADPIKPERSPQDKLAACVRLWNAAERIEHGGLVHRYLMGRGCPLPQNVDALRFAPSCPVPFETGGRPAMLASVKGPDGKGVTLHRTFLRPDGRKADMDNPRALMPGELPDGCAVRLAMHGNRLGIAEGLETALKAGERFGLPVWAALNATMLAKWKPPEGVTEVVVFGDADAKFGGQAAAYACAHRLSVLPGIERVTVEIPPVLGTDWADEVAA